MSDIRFRSAAHRDFFPENMMKCKVNDCGSEDENGLKSLITRDAISCIKLQKR